MILLNLSAMLSLSWISVTYSQAHRLGRRLERSEAPPPVYNARLQFCPQACQFRGPDTAKWTTYTDLAELGLCNETILFTLNIYNLVSDPTVDHVINACSTSGKGTSGMTSGEFRAAYLNASDSDSLPLDKPRDDIVQSHEQLQRRQPFTDMSLLPRDDSGKICGALPKKVAVDVHKTVVASGAVATRQHAQDAVEQLAKYLESNKACGQIAMFAAAGNLKAVVGVVIGGDVVTLTAGSVVRALGADIGSASQYISQSCDKSRGGDKVVGVFADLTGDVSAAQKAFAVWTKGDCLKANDVPLGQQTERVELTILTSPFDDDHIVSSNKTSSNTTASARLRLRSAFQATNPHAPRAFCRDLEVKYLDTCPKLATDCGVSGYNFEKFNSKTPNFCSTLKPGQYVCCSEGELQDHRPQPTNGMCYVYTAQPSEGCWDIAKAHGITEADMDNFNKQTWAWTGCAKGLKKNQKMCLSTGAPPMPAEDPTALCGPQVPGTTRPSNWSQITEQNPCPLNACCNIWGQCGTTEDFCFAAPEDTGAPGAVRPGSNGCISNCGIAGPREQTPAPVFRTVGYFEAWNWDRACLYMDISQFDQGRYSVVHFAFGGISNLQVTMAGNVKAQFDKMVAMPMTSKKVLSFGGWSFSNDYETAPIFRQSFSDANRQTFADRVVNFANENGLDGLDFDWEYPGATDIAGSVPGHKDDGKNYLEFLKMVRQRLPAGKTLSVALPAGYWYLRNFPVAEMSKVVDYFIYMTYDLHGQWDHGSKWASPGCPTGNCLRSHVNYTETRNAIDMLLKAGVSSHKVVLGISSYGRSFGMADPSCDGVSCFFTGDRNTSTAAKGECTDTGGYISDAEINRIINDGLADGEPVKTWFEPKSESNMMVWDNTWVAWMGHEIKDLRNYDYRRWNFGGTTDWAVDLQRFHGPIGGPDPDDDDDQFMSMPEPCANKYAGLAEVSADADNIPPHCWAVYSLLAIGTELETAMSKYDKAKADYEDKFNWYRRYVLEMIDPKIQDWMYDEPLKNPTTNTGKGLKYFHCKYKEYGEKNWEYEGDCPTPMQYKDNWGRFEVELSVKDQAGFEKGLLEDLGISIDWVYFDPRVRFGYSCDGQEQPCFDREQIYYNFPRRKGKVDVPNPKDIMEAAQANLTSLRQQISVAVVSIGTANYNGDDADAAIALGSPVAQIAQAIASMEEIKEVGTQLAEDAKKKLILNIVSLILMVVPIIGEAGAILAGAVRLARFAFIAGEIGNAAMTLVDVIESPESAPLAIAGMLFGGVGLRSRQEKRFTDAAKFRRSVDGAKLTGLGTVYKGFDDKIQRICARCYRR